MSPSQPTWGRRVGGMLVLSALSFSFLNVAPPSPPTTHGAPLPGLHGEIMSKRYLELLGGRGQTVSDQR